MSQRFGDFIAQAFIAALGFVCLRPKVARVGLSAIGHENLPDLKLSDLIDSGMLTKIGPSKVTEATG